MRVANSEFTDRPWRIHQIAPDFLAEDVWSLPTPGGPNDLARLARGFTSPATKETSSRATSFLFAARFKLGKLFGWDREDQGVRRRVQSIRDRLPADLMAGERGPDFAAGPFRSVYLTDTEWVSEVANRTVHGLMHVGWVKDDAGDAYHAQMTVLVKPNGLLGKAYLLGIKPFRYAIVYPQLIRAIGRNWPQYV